MGLWTPQGEFQQFVSNYNSRPTQSGINGSAFTINGSNSKSSYIEVVDAAVVTFNVYAMLITISNIAAASTARNALVDIGVDPTDTATYTTAINNLLCTCASPDSTFYPATVGVQFFFPLFIPAGSSIAARGQWSGAGNLTGTSMRVDLWGAPKHPELARAGSYVTTFGANTGSSVGTTVTSGTSSEGAWTDLSGADTTVPHWFWQYGFGVDTSSVSDRMYYADLGVGDGSNKQVVVNNAPIYTSTIECVFKPHWPGGDYEAPAGVRPYGRLQCSSTADINLSMCAYGVGGMGG